MTSARCKVHCHNKGQPENRTPDNGTFCIFLIDELDASGHELFPFAPVSSCNSLGDSLPLKVAPSRASCIANNLKGDADARDERGGKKMSKKRRK